MTKLETFIMAVFFAVLFAIWREIKKVEKSDD